MSNMYRGMLIVPVRVKADSAGEGLAIAKSMSVRVAGILRDSNSTWRDTGRDTQASVEVTPYAEDITDNVVALNTIVPDDPGHTDKDCPRVAIRMGCYACGYPDCESMYPAPDFPATIGVAS